MKTFLLAGKFLKREWYAGEIRLLFAAMLIAISCMASVNLFSDRIEKAMLDQASDLLGGDIALTSPTPVPEAWLQYAKKLNLQASRSLIFFSMLSVGDKLQLANIKAVEKPYPLRGQLKIADQPFEEGAVTEDIPSPGTLWMQSNLFPLLDIKINESTRSLTLGQIELKPTHVLSYQPDPPGSLFSFSPYAMMNLKDVARSGVVQPGSRVQYTTLFSGDKKSIEEYTAWLTPKLAPGQEVIGSNASRRSVENTLERVQHYLSLGSLMTLILSGVALVITLKRFTRRHYDRVALMRCYGASAREVLLIYFWILMAVGLLGIFFGCVIGYFAQNLLEKILTTFVQFPLPSPSWFGVWFSALTGCLVLLAFGLPPLWQLTRVTPLKVLRRDLVPIPLSSFWLYLSAFILIAGLMLWYTKNFSLVVIILCGCIAACLLFLLGGWGLIYLTGHLRNKVGVSWRYGLANLHRHKQSSLLQIMAFGFTLMVLLLLFIVKNDLISAWQNELPKNAPNYFVINISPEQVPAVEKKISESTGIRTEEIFPMIRGRLFLLNGKEILNVLNEDQRNDEIFQREINLSYTDALPHNNKLLQGAWFSPSQKGISVEKGLSERLGLKIGDTLGFRLGAQTIEGKIINIREVDWGSLQPNFYVLFPPGVLENFPRTYITSIYLPAEASPMIAQLIAQFPNITVINVTEILAQVQNLLTQASSGVEYLLFFAFLAGFVVLYACVYASLDERLYEAKILRALGATSSQLMRGLMAEFLTLGALAGLLAGIVANIVGIALGYKVFGLALSFNIALVAIGCLLGAMMIAAIGFVATRRVC
jgi:putative ABC transport system permease protein